MKLFVLIH